MTDVRCLLVIERNAPSRGKDMIASSCHATYHQVVSRRTILLMSLKVRGMPADVVPEIAVPVELYCDFEVENTCVSDSPSCSSIDILCPIKWRSAELSAAITVTSQHICFTFLKVKPCRGAAVEGACGGRRPHTHAHPTEMPYFCFQPAPCLIRGGRLGRPFMPFLLVL